jgi:hypothetical protein
MSEHIMHAAELRSRGFDVLVQSLGWTNAVRFLQQYERSSLNYESEREQFLPDWNAKTLAEQVERLQQSK